MATATENNEMSQLNEKMGQLKNDFKEVVSLSRQLAGEKMTHLKNGAVDKSRAAVECVSDSIEANPLRAAMVAVGVGALIGFLVSRR